MKKSILKIKNFSKVNFIAILVIVVLFFSYYGITSYISKTNEEKPRWMLCDPDEKNIKKPLYVKFHNTDKLEWDRKKSKWVKSRHKGLRKMMPTIEMHEDRSHFLESRYLWKLRPIYQSDNFYVFYQTTGGFSFFGSSPVRAEHVILNRNNLSLLHYENDWVLNGYKERPYDDEEINKLFEEASSNFYNSYEEIKDFNGRTEKGYRILSIFNCKEIPGVKPKI